MMRCFIAAAVLLSIVAAPVAAQTPIAVPSVRDHIDAMRQVRLGQEHLHAEQWDKAEAEFKAAAKLEPTLEMAHYGLGQVYMNTKRFPAAVTAYLACRDAFLKNLASLATHDLHAERVLDDQIRALEDERTLLATGRVQAMLSGGAMELDRRIAEMRATRFHDAKAMPGIPAWISIALGSAYFRSGAMADAEREYRAALVADPKLGEAHNNLAVVCMLTGRYPEADDEIKAAEKAGFKVNPQLKADLKKASARQ
jgi:tetratricopeptide (TPR) repeat protein